MMKQSMTPLLVGPCWASLAQRIVLGREMKELEGMPIKRICPTHGKGCVKPSGTIPEPVSEVYFTGQYFFIKDRCPFIVVQSIPPMSKQWTNNGIGDEQGHAITWDY
jgi:hypothetical protein